MLYRRGYGEAKSSCSSRLQPVLYVAPTPRPQCPRPSVLWYAHVNSCGNSSSFTARNHALRPASGAPRGERGSGFGAAEGHGRGVALLRPLQGPGEEMAKQPFPAAQYHERCARSAGTEAPRRHVASFEQARRGVARARMDQGRRGKRRRYEPRGATRGMVIQPSPVVNQ